MVIYSISINRETQKCVVIEVGFFLFLIGVMRDPLFASLLVEPLKMTGADVVGRSRAVRGVWSGPDVAGTSAVVDLGAASDLAVECLARDGGGHHNMVDDRPIYEPTSYEL